MLPDFLALKRDLGRALRSRVHETVESDPLAGLARHHRQHEGDRFTVVRQDGSQETRRFEQTRVTVTMETDEIRSGGETAAVAAADSVSEQISESVGRRLISEIEAASEQAGTVVRAHGFTPEAILESWERGELSFDEEGNWVPQTLLCHPDSRPALEAAFQQLEADPALCARRDEIVNRQREAWRAREARRTLVD